MLSAVLFCCCPRAVVLTRNFNIRLLRSHIFLDIGPKLSYISFIESILEILSEPELAASGIDRLG